MLLGNFLQHVMFLKSYKYFLVKSFVPIIAKVNWVNIEHMHGFFCCCFSLVLFKRRLLILYVYILRLCWRVLCFRQLFKLTEELGYFSNKYVCTNSMSDAKIKKEKGECSRCDNFFWTQLLLCRSSYCACLVFMFYLRFRFNFEILSSYYHKKYGCSDKAGYVLKGCSVFSGYAKTIYRT